MNYRLSDRIESLQPSAIREIFKFLGDPGVISFAAGNPAPEAFPVDAIAKISADIFREQPVTALQYSLTEGYTPLRDWLKADLSAKGCFDESGDDLIITAGAQQVMDLSAKVLVNEGDVIICEAPSFIGSLNTFRSYKSNLVGIPLDSEGIELNRLERALKENQGRTAFIYVIPNFQNPTGNCTGLRRRKDLLTLAEKYNTLILEDNPYGDLRFAGEDIASIKSLDSSENRVVYAGTFSKTLAPGLRVGFMSAPKQIVQKAVVALQTATVHTNIWAQLVCFRFVTETDYKAHISKLKDINRRKMRLMYDALAEYVPGEISFTKPEGGLFLWGTLPAGFGADMREFCQILVQSKVAVVPGTAFLVDESSPCNSFRLNYTTPSEEQILKGAGILGEIAGQYVT